MTTVEKYSVSKASSSKPSSKRMKETEPFANKKAEDATTTALAAQSAAVDFPRVTIEAVSPSIDCGETPIKRIAGDTLIVEADIFTDGHEAIAADLLAKPPKAEDWSRCPMTHVENDRWTASLGLTDTGVWMYCVEAWRDPYASWAADATKRAAARQDISLEVQEGQPLMARAGYRARLQQKDPAVNFAAMTSEAARAYMRTHGPRESVSRSKPLTVGVERMKARYSSWYELFPRSQAPAPGRHGKLADVQKRLPEIRDLGFDVLYFPPIHPIGIRNRKGRNNAPSAKAGDPGSVYAIGSHEGGHTAVHPELGSLDDFRNLAAAARAQGIEIALDFAVQCSPDHPWVEEHPEWFDWRPDGSIRYAENPPKKYEDIVNLKFDGAAYPSVWHALRDVALFWAGEGVSIFRVDNPHTKPVALWEWLIAEVTKAYPDTLFLSEAFTRPKMMKKLAKIGFQQSYTYFTWRNTKRELLEYATELAGETGEYLRPNFFPTTPDINPYYLQTSGEPGFAVRAALAATLSSNWGIYSGFEFCEAAPLPGREEYLDSEKYEIKFRTPPARGDIRPLIRRLNAVRRENPALQDFRNTLFLNAWNDQIIAYARMTPARDNCVVVLVNLDPHAAQECHFEVPLWEFGLGDDAAIEVEDLVLGIRFSLTGKSHWIRLDPAHRSAVIWRLIPPAQDRRTA